MRNWKMARAWLLTELARGANRSQTSEVKRNDGGCHYHSRVLIAYAAGPRKADEV
jgi:hypothetical protein